ncbi:ribosome maturation factor RimM [Poseidonibacter ostreae]|jgi:16S rRNA processing protein RimM|uniref:Ribosome maturation factor RimM n=1 Tax=Poseidonibacter ostreae TaxID=2654171 RepID=A0A6L4WNX5_9BACT|nr:ribosome maturation factor RimM [Poseidonibacter ostreae]KAB7885418.1 16S rRNA processing protein RimM [Poseidonibacter ostreae]KAB7886303.1 16S rRNA processing protein RimM [Poseidonibacter ostreae]KAB7890033.1 16S rRNA processing protein RimM [Poseidonibacter ostreae]MAC85252.1 16S rRNA processing protein RimM [Arcobacter sp.]|tara:strand:+ start:324 stop:854 length:531 start_codon:yes stop_codon:yes gene_type:complete
MNSNIYVAKLGKTVGLKGHLKLHIDSDFPEQFKKDATFITNRKIKLKVVEYNANRDVVLFENYENIDLAKKLINQELFSTPEQTRENCNLAENEFFWFDLIGCTVYENDLKLGLVKDIHRYPISDYLEIDTDESLVTKELPKTFLLPHIFDQFILNIDIEKKEINVKDAYSILENS